MTRKILTFPNPILGTVSADVLEFDGQLHTLLDDMRETMVEKKGVGLASIQVGVALNVLVIEYEGVLTEAINPKIVNSDGVQHKLEGCLSIPSVNAIVERALEVLVVYKDRHGNDQRVISKGLPAQIWQHEIEHLRGGLYIDNLSKSKLKRLKATYKKANK